MFLYCTILFPKPSEGNLIHSLPLELRLHSMEKSERWLKKRGFVKKTSTGIIIDPTLERGPKGFVLCRFCCTETKTKYNTFCSALCVHNFKIRTQPGYLRECILRRDRGVCQGCKVNCLEIFSQACALDTLEKRQLFFRNLGSALWKVKVKRCLNSLENKFTPGMFWEAAHIVDVQDGGGASGLENIRTLCVPCHQKESLVKLRLKGYLLDDAAESNSIKEMPLLSNKEDLSKPMISPHENPDRSLIQQLKVTNVSFSNLSLPLDNSSAREVFLLTGSDSSTALETIKYSNYNASGKDVVGGSSNPTLLHGAASDVKPQKYVLLNQKIPTENRKIVKKRPYSQLEIDTLIVGINQFGKSWSKIKKEYSSIFRLRTPVDLKDKARNLAKANPNYLKM